ncbi:hypothetical protein [Aquimarina megaterium]|nr:hypothetical protein [Aquimarina megaterium]
MRSTIQKFDKLLIDMKRNPYLRVSNGLIGKSTNIRLKEIILKSIDFKLNEMIHEFYDSISSVKIRWECDLNAHSEIQKYDKNDEQLYGEININTLGKMVLFDSALDNEYWTANFEKDGWEDLKQFRVFEKHDEYRKVGFLIENNFIDTNLYSLEKGATGFSTFPLNFEEYLDKLIEFKGFLGWRYNIIDTKGEDYKRMIYYLNQIF